MTTHGKHLSIPQKERLFLHLVTSCAQGFIFLPARGLDWADIDFGQKTILVRNGKGGKDRVIPMHDRLADHLWDFLQTQLPLKTPAVFRTKSGGRYNPPSVYAIVRKLLARAGISKSKKGPHLLRHTFATLLLQTGQVDLVTLQRLLGHNHLQTVLIYAHADGQSMQAAVGKFPI